LVEVRKNSLSEIKDKFNFIGLSSNWESIESEWIKICPRCNSFPLGFESKNDIPLRTISGEITSLLELSYVKAHDNIEFQQEILKSEICGCFYCLKTFSPDEIFQWHGEKCDEYEPLAFCPICGTDSVIGSASGFPIEKIFLKKMRDFWFSPSDYSETVK
jgi:hypothetical protein